MSDDQFASMWTAASFRTRTFLLMIAGQPLTMLWARWFELHPASRARIALWAEEVRADLNRTLPA